MQLGGTILNFTGVLFASILLGCAPSTSTDRSIEVYQAMLSEIFDDGRTHDIYLSLETTDHNPEQLRSKCVGTQRFSDTSEFAEQGRETASRLHEFGRFTTVDGAMAEEILHRLQTSDFSDFDVSNDRPAPSDADGLILDYFVGVASVSQVLFSDDGKEALAAYAIFHQPGFGFGGTVVLKHAENAWHVAEQCSSWIT